MGVRLTTKGKIKKSFIITAIALFAPVIVLVPAMVYGINGATDFIDWYWVGTVVGYLWEKISIWSVNIMINIQEIPIDNIDEFWKIHIKYLVDDGIISDEEDIEYFSGNEYRDIILAHMKRDIDKHHMIYFVKDNVKIGAAQYNTYQSEDGKCFILDYWVFPEYRGNGTGHECFSALEKYTKTDGAQYYELNSEKADAIRFWKELGFVENGVDEWGMKLFVKK